MEIARDLAALVIGGVIGLGFGLIQTAAHRRNARLQDEGKLASGWAVMPGSARRVASLLVILVVVQLGTPALFAGAGPWWVSAGVAAGYGVVLFRQLWQARQAIGSVRARHG